MPLEIDWSPRKVEDWERFLSRVEYSNLIQTRPYALAMRAVHQQFTRFGLILIDGAEAGIVQVQEIKLLRVVHLVFLDRGPLWFGGIDCKEAHELFWPVFEKSFSRRWGRRRRILPEMEDDPVGRDLLSRTGFTRVSEGYQTLWLDLAGDEDGLRARLLPKWRSTLKSALRGNIEVVTDRTGTHLLWLLQNQIEDRREKKYAAASPKMMVKLWEEFSKRDGAYLFIARQQGQKIAAVLFFRHGQGATYQVGWQNDAGRAARANYVLLWEACRALQKAGVRRVDLGGLRADAPGLAKFKQGTGAKTFTTIGIFS